MVLLGVVTNLTCSATDAPTISTTDLSTTFNNAYIFNGAIGNWDVSGVTNMTAMFASATAFNQDISTWDTSAVTNMFRMFRSATAFNQDISTWDVSQVSNFSQFMTGKTFSDYSAANLDAIYNTWSLNPSGLQSNLTIDFGTIKYTAAGQIGKDDIIFNYEWIVNDGGI
jgi:surface protein